MEKEIEALLAAADRREEAQQRLIELTGEYYSLRDRYRDMSANPSAFNEHDGQIKSVLMAERLEDIASETKELLSTVYPQIKLEPGQ
jgi:hypothetical protein